MKKFATALFVITTVLASALTYFYYQNTAGSPETVKRNTPYLRQDVEKEFNTIPTTDAAKKVSDTNELKLTIASPKNPLSISTNDSIKVAGATKKGAALLIINSAGTTHVGGVNEDGSFSPTITLLEGVNQLQIYASNFGSELKSTQREIVHLKDSLSLENPTVTSGKYLPETSDTKNIYLVTEKPHKTLAYQINKQTKFYLIEDHKKKLIRPSELDSELPLFVITDDQDPSSALIVLQQSSTPKSNAFTIGEIIDKSATLGGNFIFKIHEKHDQKTTHSILVNKDTVITNAAKEGDLSPTDIKLGDKVAVTHIRSEDQSIATKLYVQHGQASGILRDLRSNTSPSPTPTNSNTR